MAKIIVGNLLESNATYIAHQVNCKGFMGSGVAKQIRDAYPSVYASYKKACKERTGLLGKIQVCKTGNQAIINMFSQDGYGRIGKHTDYDAFSACIEKINGIMCDTDTIAFPYGIGCGLGGGNWEVIHGIISEGLPPDRTHIYKLERS